ncbi:MAG: bifunctional DNA-formamidopyrimidine glycosylase/DNA-(apurinic or apyrimidinic site) lyase [Clostridia bacterium]|nr:bifunctional DNA-formamidopyrimidine glycosylase/DNA-(apurinic or apyrimidinic site) lyase [Clostridia bacterium]
MPELPEVETVRRSLAPWVEGRRIAEVHVFSPHVVDGDPDAFARAVRGLRVRRLARRGKYLLFRMDPPHTLAVHLRMTGRLLYLAPSGRAPRVERGAPGIHSQRGRALALGWQAPSWLAGLGEAALAAAGPPQHTHLAALFDDGGVLMFNDVRKFGRVALWPGASPPPLVRLGPEPLSRAFTAERWAQILAGRRAPIKALLLDQHSVAGLGNIYADEALWRARVHPARPAASLAKEDVARLHRAVRRVLREAIDHRGTTLRDYRDGAGQAGGYAPHLRVYGRAGQPCRRCGRTLEKTVVAGRGTTYCPACQSR